ncbi:unnamed protein product [Caretta caretta]
MDHGSRFFYALEKTKGAKKHVTCLLAEDGAPLTDPVEMCGRARDFYTSLFSPYPTDPGACRVLWEELPTVSVGNQDRLELHLTPAEFSEALHRMLTNKSPVHGRADRGVLPRAVLALLPKTGDLCDLRNWRPVSLLSTDYKIVAKAISLQLGSVVADVIHPDQTYTVPCRSIFDNLFLVRDLLELGHRDGLSFALLSLDQEKAFDRVDHGYLLGTLQAFRLGPQFLYALAIKPFLCLLRRRLTGLVLWEPGPQLVLSAYADDVLLVVQDSGDLARVEACQAIYLATSSARVNWVKSSGLAVGDWRQETHTDSTAEDSWQLDCGDRVYFSHLTVRTAGVATLFSPDLWPEVVGVAEAVLGLLLHLRVNMEGVVVKLINVYAPTSGPERLQFYQQVSAFLGTLDPHECLVLGGDFNTTLEERDRSETEQCLVTADVHREIVKHHSMVNVGATTTRMTFQHSMMSFREFSLAWRGQWRAFPSGWRWWDLGKVRARLFCHDYTRGASRRRDSAIEQLEWEVLELERHLAASLEDPPLCGVCWEKRKELRALEDHRARGAFVRSRIRLLQEMDRGSHFFYALEKRSGAKKHVTCLLAEDGTPLTDPVEMYGRVKAFYTSLFSPNQTDPNACRVLWEELPMISVGDRDRQQLPLTLAEFSETLHHMPTNKSPGMDGLTVEFYRVFWDILGPDLVTVSAKSLQSGVLPLLCRRAVLALLPKKGDLRDLQNWLLSMDYKVIAKAISLRLGSVLSDVVHPDQTYTVPGLSIFDNLYLVQDLLELGCRDGLSFALLSLDQEKAFDRVDHRYLLNTLQAFGFGPQFVGFLQTLYASAECLVRLNWTLTEPVSFRRLTGLALQEPELRLVLSVYTDDVLLVVQDPGDLARVEACQAIYLAASSSRVNWLKSSGLVVGDG